LDRDQDEIRRPAAAERDKGVKYRPEVRIALALSGP
jgi:hypothetical protein